MLYLGDTSLSTAACYLAGVLNQAGYQFRYVPSDRRLEPEELDNARQLVILSDYPAARVSTELQQALVEKYQAGTSLLMIGGWESYHGLGGDWDQTLLADVLPVEMAFEDDRINVDGAAVVRAAQPQHPVLQNLPWIERPPLIGGYNRVVAKRGSQTLLEVVTHQLRWQPQQVTLVQNRIDPLLVVQETQYGRVACLMTDLAPHWVGPLVDWGTGRIKAQFPGAEAIEVGDLYAQLIRQLIGWLMYQ